MEKEEEEEEGGFMKEEKLGRRARCYRSIFTPFFQKQTDSNKY